MLDDGGTACLNLSFKSTKVARPQVYSLRKREKVNYEIDIKTMIDFISEGRSVTQINHALTPLWEALFSLCAQTKMLK